jgi:HEAT repeat protein
VGTAVADVVDLTRIAAGPDPRERVIALEALSDLAPPLAEPDMYAEAIRGFRAPAMAVDPENEAARATLADRAGELVALLGDGDPEVRSRVARLLAGVPAIADRAVSALMEAADTESDPEAEASMVLAVAALASSRTPATRVLAWLAERTRGEHAHLVEVAAAVGCGWAGADPLPAPARQVLHDAARTPPDGLDDEYLWPSVHLLRAARPADLDLAVEIVLAGLDTPDTDRRHEMVDDAAEIMRIWRAAPARLVPSLTELADDPDPAVRRHALGRVAVAGRATAMVARRLADLLDDPDAAVRLDALAGLARVGDAACLPALERVLAAPEPEAPWLSDALAGVAEHAATLVPAVRSALRIPADETTYAILFGLRAWGEPLAGLTDVLLRLAGDPGLQRVPGALPRLLGHLGDAGRPALPYLRRLLDHRRAEQAGRAAVAVWRITGSADEAVAVVHRALRDPEDGAATAAEVTRALGPDAADLRADLVPLLDHPDPRTRLRVAIALWSVTRRPDPAVTVLVAGAGPDPVGLQAVEVLAEIGPPAAGALGAIEPMATSHRRIPQCTGDECIATDERARDLAAAAVSAITDREGV